MLHIEPHAIPHRVIYDSIEALNYSGSKELLSKSPAHFRLYVTTPREATKALRLGSYVHALVLEPVKARIAFAVAPAVDRRTKDGKAVYEAFTSALEPGTTVLSAEEADEANLLAAAAKGCIDRHGFKFKATELMFTTLFMDAQLKCAIDAVGEDGYLYDLKTCEDASPAGFLKAVRAYRYNLQANFYKAAYAAGFKEHVQGFRFICVEKDTLQTAVYELGPDLMAYGYTDFIKAVDLYKSCLASNDWPGYPQEIQTLDLNKAPSESAAPINFA